jgi:hypothetical protein
LQYDADTEMLEYVCAENEKDRSHLIGKASDDKKAEVKVAPETLKQYIGKYEFKPPDHPEDPILIDIFVDGERLGATMNGGAKLELNAESDTRFYTEGAHIEFVKGDNGKVTHFNFQIVEGDFKAVRKD